jgi:hypothetical protein
MTQTTSDPVIDEIREVRHKISARFDHDPSKLVAYYMDLQERYSDRLLQERGSENLGGAAVAGEEVTSPER